MRRFVASIILGIVVMSAQRDGLAVVLAPHQSPEVSPSVSLTPTAGFFLFDSHKDLEASPTYGIRLGYDIIGRNAIDSLGVEAGLDMAMTRSKSTKSPVNVFILRTEALYSVLPRERFVPSFVVGVGGMFGDGSGSPNAFFDYGASAKYFLKDYLALRADIRQIFAYESSAARSNFESTIGLSFFLAYDKDLKRVPPIDSDGDGVPDYLDKCPDTPKGVKVDKDGCPVDSDGDGVPDYLDKCPGTPPGVKVDKDGCPLDSDGDGVPDYLDKCPGTPAGVKVDKDGCPAKTTAPAGTAEPAKPSARTAEPPAARKAPTYATKPCFVKINGVNLLDSDCDGVPDYLDKCPGTPLGVEVDQDGCPIGTAAPAAPTPAPAVPTPVPVVPTPAPATPAPAPAAPAAPHQPVPPAVPAPVAPAPEKTLAEPGVGEPAAAPVKAAPAPAELPTPPAVPRRGMSSAGYFIAAVDRCPPTPESKIVYAEKPLMKLVINFAVDKADIHPKYFGKIKEIRDFMKKNPKVFAHVEGHADYTGPFDYNVTLSRVRAINIKNQILKDSDVGPERISINAYGCSIPIANNKTSEGRRKNRRGVTVLTITITGPTVAPTKAK